MKILIIICGHEMNIKNITNINILKYYFSNTPENTVEYCGISCKDDFVNYEPIIKFKYKIINQKEQFSKICDFITEYKHTFYYDWYIKIRPDVKMFEPINFLKLCDTSINARARLYRGPKRITHGMSVNGEGCWKYIGDCFYAENETDIILDDMLFIFHNNIVNMGAFNNNIIIYEKETEWTQTKVWKLRNINLNVIGIYLENTKYNAFSGNLNICSF
jgi:hypothetical protein